MLDCKSERLEQIKQIQRWRNDSWLIKWALIPVEITNSSWATSSIKLSIQETMSRCNVPVNLRLLYKAPILPLKLAWALWRPASHLYQLWILYYWQECINLEQKKKTITLGTFHLQGSKGDSSCKVQNNSTHLKETFSNTTHWIVFQLKDKFSCTAQTIVNDFRIKWKFSQLSRQGFSVNHTFRRSSGWQSTLYD